MSDGLHAYFFPQNMGKAMSMTEEMDGEVFIYHQSRHVSLMDYLVKVLFPICDLTWRVNIYVSRQRKGINKRNESNDTIITFNCLLVLNSSSEIISSLLLFKTLFTSH